MELSVTTSRQLQHLACHHPTLKKYFGGVKASDRMPVHPTLDHLRGYIVNLDRHDQPGSHWIGLWTDGSAPNSWTVMPSRSGKPTTCPNSKPG